VEVTLQCVCCGYERRRIEHYRDFSLDLPPPLPTPSPVVADNSPSPLTTSSSTKMPQVPCPFFNRSSGCKDGANCKFAHSASSSSACGKDSTSSTTSSTSSTSNIGSRPSPAVCLESLLEQFFGQETLQVDCEKCPGKVRMVYYLLFLCSYFLLFQFVSILRAMVRCINEHERYPVNSMLQSLLLCLTSTCHCVESSSSDGHQVSKARCSSRHFGKKTIRGTVLQPLGTACVRDS